MITKPYKIYLEPEMWLIIKKIALDRGLTASAVAREILNKGLK